MKGDILLGGTVLPEVPGPGQVVRVSRLGMEAPAYVMTPYGVSSSLPKDTLGLVLSIGGNPSNLVFIPMDGAGRILGLLPGENVFHGPTLGAQLAFNLDGRMALGNDAGELFDILDQLIGALQTATVATMLGPQPLDAATQATLLSLKAIVALLKGVLK